MLPISVCIIAKNEEKCIEECLKRLSKYDWEIVVADTGSTDCTVEIASKYTSSIYHFDWVNDFSAARNFAASKAQNDFILALDCDEYLEEDAHTAEIITKLPFLITDNQIGFFLRKDPLMTGDDSSAVPLISTTHIMRFYHKSKMHFEGMIHEQLVSKTGAPKDYVSIPLSFYHVGYETLALRKKKAERNIALLETDLAIHPDDTYILFQLGQSYFSIGDYGNALSYFDAALALELDEQAEYVQTMIESYGYCLLHLKQFERALELEGIYDIFSKRADFVFLMGLIYMNNALFAEAIAQFRKATTIANHSMDGVNSYSANYNIGVIYECMGQTAKAIKYYADCGSYPPALTRLSLLTSKNP